MTNFASALKAEILRLARKEVRKEIEGLQNVSARHRSEIAALKRQVASLEKQVARGAGKGAPKNGGSDAEAPEAARRFSAKGFATHRKRLGLSAEEAGMLLEVSAQTVYGWEKGTKPRQSQLEAIATFRKLGKRTARKLLDDAQTA